MEAQVKQATKVRHRKISLQKILWSIKKAEEKQNRLRDRKAKLDRKIEQTDLRIRRLALVCRRALAELEATGWDRADFEVRTGLKLPD